MSDDRLNVITEPNRLAFTFWLTITREDGTVRRREFKSAEGARICKSEMEAVLEVCGLLGRVKLVTSTEKAHPDDPFDPNLFPGT